MAHSNELQLDRPRQFLTRERSFQRLGVATLTAFVAAGALGAFGDGPLAHARTSEGGIDLRYERFGRTTSPTMLSLSVGTNLPEGEPIRFRVERAFLQDVTLLEIRPADALHALEDSFAVFEVPAAGGRGHVELRYQPNRFGVLRSAVTLEAAGSARFWQLIYF